MGSSPQHPPPRRDGTWGKIFYIVVGRSTPYHVLPDIFDSDGRIFVGGHLLGHLGLIGLCPNKLLNPRLKYPFIGREFEG